jgi:WD40 repeat protein
VGTNHGVCNQRARTHFAAVGAMREHKAWVVHTHMQRNGVTLVSGSVKGDVRFWDIRNAKKR